MSDQHDLTEPQLSRGARNQFLLGYGLVAVLAFGIVAFGYFHDISIVIIWPITLVMVIAGAVIANVVVRRRIRSAP